jgi:hypothetical protein
LVDWLSYGVLVMSEFQLGSMKLQRMGIVVGILGGFHGGWCLRTVRLGGLLEMVYVMIIWWCFLEVCWWDFCCEWGVVLEFMVMGFERVNEWFSWEFLVEPKSGFGLVIDDVGC